MTAPGLSGPETGRCLPDGDRTRCDFVRQTAAGNKIGLRRRVFSDLAPRNRRNDEGYPTTA